MSGARETILTFFVIWFIPMKMNSYTGYNSHIVWDNILIIFDRGI